MSLHMHDYFLTWTLHSNCYVTWVNESVHTHRTCLSTTLKLYDECLLGVSNTPLGGGFNTEESYCTYTVVDMETR